MFVQLFSLAFLLFTCSAQQSTDLNFIEEKNHFNFQKSITAACESSNTVNCTYSVLFSTTFDSTKAFAEIFVNDQVQASAKVILKSKEDTVVVNFNVSKGDSISLNILALIHPPLYEVYNQPDAKGSVIFSSTSRTFLILNTCEGNCTYTIRKRLLSPDWVSGATITITVNNEAPIIFTGQKMDFNISKGDILLFNFNAPTDITGLSVVLYTFDKDLEWFQWYQDIFASPISLINPCGKKILPPSPFGGDLFPITDEEIDTFLQYNYSPLLWLTLTSDD